MLIKQVYFDRKTLSSCSTLALIRKMSSQHFLKSGDSPNSDLILIVRKRSDNFTFQGLLCSLSVLF